MSRNSPRNPPPSGVGRFNEDTPHLRQRSSDRWLAPFSALWDWVDNRDIGQHTVSVAVMFGTVKVTEWSMVFAAAHADTVNGIGVAAIIGAVTGPYMALQAAAIKFYFESRSK